MNTTNLRGFTLLELLVALSIFAVIAVMAYGGLNIILTIHAETEQQAHQLADLQMMFTWLQRDIQQQVERPIRNEYGDKQPSIQGDRTYLEFTHAGWHNPVQLPRSSLQRVAYRLGDKKLFREYWNVLDRAQDTKPIEIDLMKEVENLEFRFLDNRLQWHEHWPDTSLVPPESDDLKLRAIEVTLEINSWGKLTRLFQIESGINVLN